MLKTLIISIFYTFVSTMFNFIDLILGMRNTKIKYKKINVDDLAEFVVFTDLNLEKLEGSFAIEENIMFQCFEKSNDPFEKLYRFLSKSNFKNPENIKKVVLLFLQSEYCFQNEFVDKSFLYLYTKFKSATLVIGLQEDNALFSLIDCNKIPKSYNIDLLKVDGDIKKGQDLCNFINYLLMEKIRPVCCYPTSIVKCLKTRLKCDVAFLKQGENFFLLNYNAKFRFVKSTVKNFYCVYDISKNCNENYLLIIKNSHLFGLYSFTDFVLFVECLHEIRKKVKIRIEYDEVVLNQSNLIKRTLDVPKLFQRLSNELNFFTICSTFKIQLFSNSYLIFNRSLKISLSVLEQLLNYNFLPLLLKLANLYFKCFSKSPICCRMQSIASEADVYDFEKFTFLHIKNNISLYIKMCKLFFPFVSEVKVEYLKKPYLEIIPVSLIQRFHNEKLENFIKKLEDLIDRNIAVIPLSDGNFQIGSYFVVSAKILSKMLNIQKVINAAESLMQYSNSDFSLCPLHECFNYDSKLFFQVKNGIVDAADLEELQKYDNNVLQKFGILTIENHQVLALKFKGNNVPAEIDKIVISACKEFSEAFDNAPKFSILPYFNYRFTFLKKFYGNNIRIGYFNNGYTYVWQQKNQDNKLLAYKNRFFFSRALPVTDVDDIVNEMLSFEEEEGIYLSIVKNRIEMLENMDITILELDPDYYKATADYCYYNKDDLLLFLQQLLDPLNKPLLEDLYFEITNFGSIKFLNSIEIFPSIILKIKNTAKLFKIIKKLAKLFFIKEIHRKYSLNIIMQMKASSNSHNHTDESVMRLAKLLNPLLNVITNPDIFKKLPLICIPEMFYRNPKIDDLCYDIQIMRMKKFKIRVSSDRERFLIDCLDGNTLSTAIQKIDRFLEIMEEINSSFKGNILINEFFSVIDYDQFEKKVFLSYEENHDITEKQLNNCIKIFENNPVKSVAIVNNQFFQINTVLHISAIDLLSLSPQHQKLFFEATEILTEQRKAENIYLSKACISLANDDNEVVEQIKSNKKYENFTILDDNKKTYQKLATFFNDCLAENPSILYQYKWLEALPRHMLLNKEEASKLLWILESLKAKGIRIKCINALIVGYCDLTVSKWLAIKDIDKFVLLLNSIVILNNCKIGNIKFSLFFQGLFSYIPQKEDVMINSTPERQEIVKKQVSFFLNLMKEKHKFLPITLNSGANIMIGNFIWFFVDEVEGIQNEIFKIILNYEEAIEEEEVKDLMRSICDLKEREKAINLAKIMNKNLKYFDDDLICNKNLKIFPTPFWKACNENVETFEIAKKVFQKLSDVTFSYSIKMNGHIQLGSHIVVTVKDILNFYKNLETNILLLENLQKILKQHLICEEEIEYDQKAYKKEYEFKPILVEKSTRIKQELMKEKIEYRIEPNGILFLNNNIWTNAAKMSEAVKISKIIVDLFPNRKFMYSNPGINIAISILTSTEEEIFQYCYNMCQYVNEKYPDIKIQYIAKTDTFKFNEVLSIHPRSFFHLQEMEDVVAVIRDAGIHKDNRDKFEKDKSGLSENEIRQRQTKLQNEEAKFCQKLWKMKKVERLEFDLFMKEKFYAKLCEILQNKITLNPKKPYNGIEDIQIQGENIFCNGSTLDFVNTNEKTGKIEYVYKDDQIIKAYELADKLDENFKCKNLFDFQSLIEIVKFYPKYDEISKDDTQKEFHDKINWWLRQVQKEQDKHEKKYKFVNALKGLHHWFKHPGGFKDLKDYYSKMNEFFDSTNYGYEIHIQNGEFMSRKYENEKYIGYYKIAHKGSDKIDYVASFWYMRQKPFNFSTENPNATFLIITNTNFSNFESDNEVILNEKIIVKTNSKLNTSNCAALNTFIAREKFDGIEKIKAVLFFLSDISKTEKKKKSVKSKEKEDDFASQFETVIATIKKKFNDITVIFCYYSDTDLNIVKKIEENKPCNFEIVEIEKSLIEKKDAIELNKFLETKFHLK